MNFKELSEATSEVGKFTLLSCAKVITDNSEALSFDLFNRGNSFSSLGINSLEVFCDTLNGEGVVIRNNWADHMHVTGIGHVFSAQAMELFEHHSNPKWESYPVIFKDMNGTQLTEKSYFLANFTYQLDCIDHDLSVIQIFGKHIKRFKKLGLDGEKIPRGVNNFILQERPRTSFFEKSLIQAIEKAGLTGFVFRKIEDIRI